MNPHFLKPFYLILLVTFVPLKQIQSQENWPQRFTNQVFNKNIKTVRLHIDGLELSTPIISLNSFDKLHFSFDDLDGDFKNYYYTLIHCSQDWSRSDISSFDYVEGFTEDQITDYAFSFNTLQDYTHYQLQLPNESMKITKSGNYIIAVFADNDLDQIILTRQFFVMEPYVEIEGQVKRTMAIRYSSTHQEIDFTINHKGYSIQNPFDEIQVMVRQNKRPDNAISNLKPSFVHDEALVYDYETEILYQGGKEFRWFDMQSIRYQKERIKMVEMIRDTTHVYIAADPVASFEKYYYRKDMNGQYFINLQEGNNPNLEPDYVIVHFTLPFKTPLNEGEIYVTGSFNDWCVSGCKPMIYNFDRKSYEATYYLKQGYYNYVYGYLEEDQKTLDIEMIEGSSFETENEYEVFVYHKTFGSRYQKLIGYSIFNSLY